MAKPMLSRTLSEFWGQRWNLGFRQLAYELIFRPRYRKMGVAAAGSLVFLATARIQVDAFYFSHEDWPRGRELVVGHILLTSLFVVLAASYWALFLWQVWITRL